MSNQLDPPDDSVPPCERPPLRLPWEAFLDRQRGASDGNCAVEPQTSGSLPQPIIRSHSQGDQWKRLVTARLHGDSLPARRDDAGSGSGRVEGTTGWEKSCIKLPAPPLSCSPAWCRPSGALGVLLLAHGCPRRDSICPSNASTSFTDTQTCAFPGLIGHIRRSPCAGHAIPGRCLAVASVDWPVLGGADACPSGPLAAI
jgi:hypothetical protein